MQRFASGIAFDERPMPAIDSEAIDFRAASELFAPFRKLSKRGLATLHLTTTHQGHEVPTAGGVLLFGRDRPTHSPDAWIQAARFRGIDTATIVDHVDLKGPLVCAIDLAVTFVEKHSLRGAAIGRLRRQDR